MKQRDRILVVDDDGDACELLATVLGQAGYSVEVARDGFEALAMMAAKRPDLVLTDLQMPGMTGIELVSRVHEQARDMPAVIMTAAETRDLCTAAEAYGCTSCLPKPINLDELLWTIECALAVRRSAATASYGPSAAVA